MDAEYVPAQPHPALRGIVLGYGGYREQSARPVRRRQVPTGSYTLILSFGPPLRLHGPAGPSIPASFLAGMHDAAVVTEFVGVQHGLQVDLTPLGAYTLLGTPLTNIAPRLDELDVPELAALPERLAAAAGWPARFALTDAVLLRLAAAARAEPDPEVEHVWRQLASSGGTAPIGTLAAETGWSRRHLLTRFRGQIGLAPKAMGRVLRLQRAANLIVPTLSSGGAGRPTGKLFSDVAARCGYADQAHLVREFRELAGCTPSEYRGEWTAAAPP